LNARIPSDLSHVYADPERLGQVLRNLMDNALTNTQPGGNVSVETLCENGMVKVCVRDTGIDIAPEHIPNIFERFYRADKSRTRSTDGADLGLAIVKQLIEAQGSSVAVENTHEKGTSVSFTCL
jgi:two-component system sensor histidine kinase BaeS